MAGYATPKTTCGRCGKEFDMADYVGEDDGRPHEPRPGDVTVCFYCGEWHRFGDDFVAHQMTEDQLATIPGEIFLMLSRVSRAVQAFWEMEKVKKERRPQWPYRKISASQH